MLKGYVRMTEEELDKLMESLSKGFARREEMMSKFLACYTYSGRWTPNEDRPAHAIESDADATLCGISRDRIMLFEDAELGTFDKHKHGRCARCEKSMEKREK